MENKAVQVSGHNEGRSVLLLQLQVPPQGIPACPQLRPKHLLHLPMAQHPTADVPKRHPALGTLARRN